MTQPALFIQSKDNVYIKGINHGYEAWQENKCKILR